MVDEIEERDKLEVNTDQVGTLELGTMVVVGAVYGETGDAIGYDEVYSRDMSSLYRGSVEIQRNKGLSTADLLKGMTGVYSGDARNSGALDVNIRGIQGQGRVPVTIDGTEQAISVYRGYFGVSNRNYIDPSMISSITVENGGALTPGVKTSVGGGVAMTTIGIDDVVAQDEKFGIDVQMDTGSNATKPRISRMELLGTDYRDDSLYDASVLQLDHPSFFLWVIKNVVERDYAFNITQKDKQKTKGIELQARYEGQRYFANVGVNYNLKNKTCDVSSAMVMNPSGAFPTCVDGGFPNGFLRTNLIPKYSVNLTVGGKFFNDKLEVGTTFNYHSKARNGQEQAMVASGQLNREMVGNNAPIRWNSVFLVDAFLNYQIDDNLSINFTGQNLTNEYYLDPLTRSYMPAPGRTFRICFKGTF